MAAERKIIVYIATSADGYIARADGGADWLNRRRTVGDYGMGAFFKSIDTILWGRKTYDMARGFSRKGAGLGFGPQVKNYVFSRQPPDTDDGKVEFVREPIPDFARRLRAEAGKDIWVMGGAGLIASLLEAHAIDEFMIHVIPVFIGDGIPLIERRQCTVPLELLGTQTWADGVVELHYTVLLPDVKKSAPAVKKSASTRRSGAASKSNKSR